MPTSYLPVPHTCSALFSSPFFISVLYLERHSLSTWTILPIFLSHVRCSCFHERSVSCSMYLLLSERVLMQLNHSTREASIKTKKPTNSTICTFLQQTTISLASKRVGTGPKLGLRKVSLQACFTCSSGRSSNCSGPKTE